jgi:hypothetical protein
MDTITLFFEPGKLNTSIQVGDTVYYCDTRELAGKQIATKQDLIEIGKIIFINNYEGIITCLIDLATTTPPTAGSFILFSKDNKVNLNDLVGYYAEVKMKNGSTDPAEMFSVGCDVFQSSK